MPLRLGQREFADNEFAVMAIINRTPDSFFDQGATFATEAALAAIDRLPDSLFQPYGASPEDTSALRERMRAWARRISTTH